MVFTILCLCSCSSSGPIRQSDGGLCDFHRSPPRTIVQNQKIDKSVVDGPVSQSIYIDSGIDKIAAALAEPTKTKFNYTERNSFCCQWGFHPYNGQGYWCVVWPECKRTVKVKNVFGIARAPDMKAAEELALESCISAAEQFADSEENVRIRARHLKCRVIQRDWCFL